MGKIVVLGAGPAGISAAYHLRELDMDCVVYEKRNDYGGLCGGFEIDGFHFDRFAHLTFSKNEEVNQLLEQKTPYLVHQPEAMNFYKGNWVRNPVQNNLNGLPIDERIKVIKDFAHKTDSGAAVNYGEWLRQAYGDYFTENFPARYTRKYWTVEPEQLEPRWVEKRMYRPSMDEILRGAFEKETPNVHYSKEMHYPKRGGFRRFLDPLAEHLDIRYEKNVCKIDFHNKRIRFEDGEEVGYDRLISTLPMNRIPEFDDHTPDEVKEAASRLDYTSGYMISVGVNKLISFPTIWFYIYDEDILPARVYFPDKKSRSNVPEGCSSLQAEVYTSKYKPLELSKEEILEKVIDQLAALGLYEREDVLVKDIRFEEYANIMFTPSIYEARAKVRDYLESNKVVSAGRFGEWDYLWLEQSLMSGKRAAEQVAAMA